MSQLVKFMFDECIGTPIMKRLQELVDDTCVFQHVCERFTSGVPDDEWIPELGTEGGWVVISADRAKRSSKGGKLPLLCRQFKVTSLLLSATLAQKRSDQKLACLLLMWKQILELHQSPPGSQFLLRYRETKLRGMTLLIELLDG